jgi:hypothetical protein
MKPIALKDAVHGIWQDESKSPELRILAQAIEMLWQEIDHHRVGDRKPTLPSPRVKLAPPLLPTEER